jgi:PIN domain nuclease of toxin-antitoxin system
VRLLLDTRLVLWSQIWPERLSAEAERLILNEANALLFSTVTLTEVAIKRALGRPDFAVDPRRLRSTLIENGYAELPVLGEHACTMGDLPPIHKDPFDRLLVAQARAEGVTLLTSDAAVAAYGGVVRRV